MTTFAFGVGWLPCSLTNCLKSYWYFSDSRDIFFMIIRNYVSSPIGVLKLVDNRRTVCRQYKDYSSLKRTSTLIFLWLLETKRIIRYFFTLLLKTHFFLERRLIFFLKAKKCLLNFILRLFNSRLLNFQTMYQYVTVLLAPK